MTDVVAKVKRVALQLGGENGIRGLSRSLGIATDDDGATFISKTALNDALSAYGVKLTDSELQRLAAYLDRQGDGTVVPAELTTALRTGLPPLRRALIHRTFDSLDKDDTGAVSVQQLLSKYDAGRHPSVLLGERTADAVYADFQSSFNIKTNPTGVVTRQELEEYLAGVSAFVDDDQVFHALITGTWHLSGYYAVIQPSATDLFNRSLSMKQAPGDKETLLDKLRIRDLFQKTIDAHRRQLLIATTGFRGVGRLFRQADPTNTGYLPRETFIAALWNNRLYFDHEPTLGELDTKGDGTIDYVAYMQFVLGELPPCRRLALERLWKSFPRDRHNKTDINVIHKRYHAPDGESLSHFLDAWDKRALPSLHVSFQELEEWMVPVSAKCRIDSQFQEVLRMQWGA